jgi:hypothetical protein
MIVGHALQDVYIVLKRRQVKWFSGKLYKLACNLIYMLMLEWL